MSRRPALAQSQRKTSLYSRAGGRSQLNERSGFDLFEFLRRRVDQRGFVFQHGRNPRDLGIGFLPVFLLDGLAYSGDGLRAVTGIDAGCVDHVLVPGPAEKALLSCEPSLAVD